MEPDYRVNYDFDTLRGDLFGALTSTVVALPVALRGSFTVASSHKLASTIGADIKDHEVVIFDFSQATYVDDSAAMVIKQLLDVATEEQTEFIVMGLAGSVAKTLHALNILRNVPEDRIVKTLDEARQEISSTIDPDDSRPGRTGSLNRWLAPRAPRSGGCCFPVSYDNFWAMLKHRLPIALILLCVSRPVFGVSEALSCADNPIVASAVRTTKDVQAFVQCAYEFVQEMGFEEARRAFNEDERWKSGPIYVFVSEATPMSDQARLFVFPFNRSLEGSSLGLLIDAFGNDYYREQNRIVRNFGEGLLHYSFTNPVTGRDEPKVSYIKRIEWEGNLARHRRRNLPPRSSGHLLARRGQRPGAGGQPFQPQVAGVCPVRRPGTGIEGLLRHHHPVRRSAVEEQRDLLVRPGYVRQRALQRRSL